MMLDHVHRQQQQFLSGMYTMEYICATCSNDYV